MAKERLKIGIFGARMGGMHLKIFKALSEMAYVTAVCEKDVELHDTFGDWIEPDCKFYTDFDEFIKSGIDAVILANYFDEHAKYAIKCFEAGVDVLSETTAAPSLAECVELVEAAEKYGRKYALAVCCTYFKGVYPMKTLIESGEFGKVLSADAEYHHGHEPTQDSALVTKKVELDLENLHWRKTMPSCYYNMHTLAPLMMLTNTMPETVYCNSVENREFCEDSGKLTDTPGAITSTKMDNGAVFNTTGCASYIPTSKWYRINCEKGCLETERTDWRESKIVVRRKADRCEIIDMDGMESGLNNKEIQKIQANADTSHHGGINFYTGYHFVKYLLGEEESLFDVYKAATVSACGILAWYSSLTGKEFRVPDFKNKADRDLIRHDCRKPFAKRYADMNMPCRMADKDKFDLYDPKYKFGL